MYSHCVVVKNEKVDRAAVAALSLMEFEAPAKSSDSYVCCQSRAKNAVRFRLGGKCSFSDEKGSATLSRRDESLLIQLRTGDCRLLGDFVICFLRIGSVVAAADVSVRRNRWTMSSIGAQL